MWLDAKSSAVLKWVQDLGGVNNSRIKVREPVHVDRYSTAYQSEIIMLRRKGKRMSNEITELKQKVVRYLIK